MTTVTGLTADRMLAIEAASVVSGTVDASGNLILTKHDGSQINAGPVKGPPGPQGPVGSDLQVLSAVPILDVGVPNQIRAGRQLSPADFANIGLNPPLGLWNLSDLTDASGYGRNLQNKGAVPFGVGVNGAANTAAQFSGSTAQCLYIPDTGAADPFRIKSGTFGCWHKTGKRDIGAGQILMAKWTATPQVAWRLQANAGGTGNNYPVAYVSTDGTNSVYVSGVSDVCDDRWHFLVVTYDGNNLRIYVDGVQEGSTMSTGPIFGGSSVLNLGSIGGDASNASASGTFGRMDEAFITSDVLSDDQIRNLYCAKIAHTLAAVPTRLSLNVRRRRKGGAFAASDFPTQPLRLHNFSAGSLADEGSNNIALVNNGAAGNVVGADGAAGNAYYFNGAQTLSASDAGLPVGTASRSLGAWIKTTTTTAAYIFGYGIVTQLWAFGIQTGGYIITSDGAINITGPPVADGNWHFVVFVGDNGALDGAKEKIYIDGRLVGEATTFGATVLGGANFFRVGALPNATSLFTGHVDGAFICDYALTAGQIQALYAKGSQALTPSPKNVGDHVEAMDAANLLVAFDSLDSQHQIDLKVAA